MDCSEVRRRLWPADILRVNDADVEAALEHARVCPGCEVFLERDRRVAELIRETVPRVRAPSALRERLYNALARERAGTATPRTERRRLRSTLLVAGLLIAGLALGTLVQRSGLGVRTSPATAFAEDYLRRVVEREALDSGDRQQVASFFARELGVAVALPEIPGFDLDRATICLMNGRRGGVVEYRSQGRHFSYYLVPLSRETAANRSRRPPQLSTGSAAVPGLGHESGLGVATWQDAEHQHALVGNLAAQELRRLAPLFAAPSSRL